MLVTETMAREAAELLLLTWGERWNVDNVSAAYRYLSKKAHPDLGGSAEAFVALDRAKCVLLEWLKKQPAAPTEHTKRDCPDCDGKGHFVQASKQFGNKGLRRQCPRCHGSGDLDLDIHGLY